MSMHAWYTLRERCASRGTWRSSGEAWPAPMGGSDMAAVGLVWPAVSSWACGNDAGQNAQNGLLRVLESQQLLANEEAAGLAGSAAGSVPENGSSQV